MSDSVVEAGAIRRRVAAVWDRRILDTLCQYVRIECLSPLFDPDWIEHGTLLAAAELLAQWCRSRPVSGLTAEIVQLPGRTPVLLVEVPTAGRSSGHVLIYGHLDKQPPQGDWRQGLGPFLPVLEGDHFYGRGTADDGYSVFAAVTAVEALGDDRPAVTILIEASEESASPDLPAYLDHLAERIGTPSLVLCLDSGGLTFDRLWLTSSLRGGVGITVRVDVLDEGVHSGSAGGVVPDSFRLLRQLLSRLEDEDTGELRLPELRCEVPERHRLQAALVAAEFPESVSGDFPGVEGLVYSGGDPAGQLLAKSWAPSLAVIGADGLPELASAGNVLRPYTSVKLAMRLPPTVDATAATAAMVAALTADPPQGSRVAVDVDLAADGWEAPEPPPWLAQALDAASLACFDKRAGNYGEGGTIPFLATLGARLPGVPLVATGVLGPHTNHHGPNESLFLPMAEAVTVAVACAMAALPEV